MTRLDYATDDMTGTAVAWNRSSNIGTIGTSNTTVGFTTTANGYDVVVDLKVTGRPVGSFTIDRPEATADDILDGFFDLLALAHDADLAHDERGRCIAPALFGCPEERH